MIITLLQLRTAGARALSSYRCYMVDLSSQRERKRYQEHGGSSFNTATFDPARNLEERAIRIR